MTEAATGAHEAGGTCLNCATALAGPFCHACGQEAGPTHRSLLHIAAEFAEALTHGDSRVLRTARLLAFHPGRLTRDYLDGRRVADSPPLRIYFVSLFVLFFELSATHAFSFHVDLGTPPAGWEKNLVVAGHPRLSAWLVRHVGHAVADPNEALARAAEWAERLSLFMLPITALGARAVFLGRRPRIVLYDHTIFALHSLAFAMLLLALLGALAPVPGMEAIDVFVLLVLPVHLFRHLREAFGGGWFATALRTLLLFTIELVGFGMVCLGLLMIGLEWG